MTHLRLLIFLSILIFLVSCEKDNPTSPKDSPPVLSNLAVPDTILTGIGQSYLITVKCEDQNGLENIDSVRYKILSKADQLLVSEIMFDDGSHGDNVPKDGKYSIRLTLDLKEESYRFVVHAVDRANLRSNELNTEFYVKPGNFAPIITRYHIPDTVYVDEIVPFYFSVQATDPDSLDFIKAVTYQILEPSLAIAEQGELKDQGINGDSLAGDGIYSSETTTAFASWKFGPYRLIIQAFDNHNNAGESISNLPWAKKNVGVAPQILNVSAPEMVQLPITGDKSFILTARVTDLDTNKDIKAVFFNTFKPDGSASSGNPFKMYDNGTSGDAVAGDYIYSLRIYIGSQNSPGNYRFEFQAKDYSDLLSNKIIHIITVTQ